MAADEVFFHRVRRLPKWERWGHPLDTLTVMAPVFLAWTLPVSSGSVLAFLMLSIFSCAFVTKDEFVHHRECGATEHFLHALLFVIHPLVFLSVAIVWPLAHGQAGLPAWWPVVPVAEYVLPVFLVLGFLMGCYQLIYWNWYGNKQ